MPWPMFSQAAAREQPALRRAGTTKGIFGSAVDFSVTALTDTPSWQLGSCQACRGRWRCNRPSSRRLWGSRCRRPPRHRLKRRHQPLGQAPADRRPVPRRGVHEVVQRLVVHLAQPVGHRFDRPAAAIEHQPAHIAQPAGTLILAAASRRRRRRTFPSVLASWRAQRRSCPHWLPLRADRRARVHSYSTR